MRIYRIHQKQLLPIPLTTAWDFLSDPKNLEIITPGSLGMKIIKGDDRQMYPGQIIEYKLSPFPGITSQWLTEITHVVENRYFVDEQRFGPYKLWHHKHFIHSVENGVEMEDIVDYALPMGILGKLAHNLYIKDQLSKIFSFREQKLIELFGTYGS